MLGCCSNVLDATLKWSSSDSPTVGMRGADGDGRMSSGMLGFASERPAGILFELYVVLACAFVLHVRGVGNDGGVMVRILSDKLQFRLMVPSLPSTSKINKVGGDSSFQ